jgi:predicted DNA-binding transcriptional regulator YafY
MSTNKKAITRYQVYDKCLRNTTQKYNRERLTKEVNEALYEEGLDGIGKTQFYDDLKFMTQSEWKAPIETYKDGRNAYYRYADPSYSISNQALNESEANQLKSAIQVLSRFKGLPQFDFIHEIIPNIEIKLGLVTLEKEVIDFESNIDYVGKEYITPLFNAIVNKRALTIAYQSFKSPSPFSIEFHPYYLKQYNNRWFVFGLNDFNKIESWNMALDRIKSIEESKTSYIESETDWSEYFDDMVGVTRIKDAVVENVKLWFHPDSAPYIISKPIHQSQKSINTELGLEVNIKVVLNYELESLILSHGERVKVIEPECLRLLIQKRIKGALE